MLELKNVSKSFGPTRALEPLDLSIAAGQTTVLIGPSGCGKSTILRLMIGLVRPDAGRVEFDGRELRPDNAAAARQQMGYVIQDGGLFPHLTAYENVAVMARHLGWPQDRIQSRVDEVATLARFPSAGLNRFPVQLSGGQRQRVSLMRALMLDPQVLLLDEPLGSLDPITRSDLQADLRSAFRALSKTVVLVTHDMSEADYFADHIVLMNEGRILQRSTLAEMIDAPADPFVSRFIRAQRSSPALRGGRDA